MFHVQCRVICKILLHISLIFEYKCNHSGSDQKNVVFVGPLSRVRPRNSILALGLVVLVVILVPLRSEFIGEL